MRIPTQPEVAGLSRSDREALLERGWALVHRMDLDLLRWSVLHRVEDGRALDFDAFPFQRELYEAFGDRGFPRWT